MVAQVNERLTDLQEVAPGVSELLAWSLPHDAAKDIALGTDWPAEVTREWAWGGATGKGVRVCILDSGVDASHPTVGRVESAVAVSKDDGRRRVRRRDDIEGDVCGHGTACAGIVRSLAPEAELHSVRVLGAGFTGGGNILLAGLRYAIEQGFDVDQHEPLDDEEATTQPSCTSSPTRRTSSARCSSPPRTTCPSRATRGGSRRSSRSAATRRTTR